MRTRERKKMMSDLERETAQRIGGMIGAGRLTRRKGK